MKALVFSLNIYFICTYFIRPSSLVSTTPSETTADYLSIRTTTFKCEDALPDCESYGKGSCSGVYEAWARKNCQVYCGFCDPPPTEAPPCIDTIDNCAGYGNASCKAYVSWAKANCRLYCRYCTEEQLKEIDSRTTTVATIPPELCVDKLECRYYGNSICSDPNYTGWAQNNCPLYCNYCTGVPTPPKPCMDVQPDCPSYGSDVCYDPQYTVWVQDHCPKFCGLCGSVTRPGIHSTEPTPNTPSGMTSHSASTASPGSTATSPSISTPTPQTPSTVTTVGINTPTPATGFKTPPTIITPHPPTPPPRRTHTTMETTTQ